MSRASLQGLLPLQDLLHPASGERVPLPPVLRHLYGELRLARPSRRPYVLANFASTLDGVVAVDGSTSGGSEVSGFNDHDRMVMGLLRSVSEVIVVGAGTLRSVPRHLWSLKGFFPALDPAFQEVRASLGLPPSPRLVFVSARGEVDLDLPVFRTGTREISVFTTPSGRARLSERELPPGVDLWVAGEGPRLRPSSILRGLQRRARVRTVLVEGGPSLFGDFLEAGLVDELFVTLAPFVAGRDAAHRDRGLVEGHRFSPPTSLGASLVGLQRGGSHLFLRYRFPARR